MKLQSIESTRAAKQVHTIRAVVYILGHHHIYTHIIPPRRHAYTHKTPTKAWLTYLLLAAVEPISLLLASLCWPWGSVPIKLDIPEEVVWYEPSGFQTLSRRVACRREKEHRAYRSLVGGVGKLPTSKLPGCRGFQLISGRCWAGRRYVEGLYTKHV